MLGESYPMSIILSGMLGKISRLKLRLLISRAVCIPIDIWNLIWTNLTKNPNTLCNIRSTFISISWFCRNRHFRQFGDTSGEQSKRMEHYSIFCTWLASDGIEKVLLTKNQVMWLSAWAQGNYVPLRLRTRILVTDFPSSAARPLWAANQPTRGADWCLD